MKHTFIKTLVLLILLTLSACSGLDLSNQPKVALTDCSAHGVFARCGIYTVYENRATQTGRQIDLNIVILPATGAEVLPDPLFFFAGGPGGVATANAPSFAKELSKLNQKREIVLIDQRGVGGSHPLSCPQLEGVSGLSDGDRLVSYYESCLESLDADLRWYTTKAYVDDVNEVRHALGYDKINIAGESYGGTVVQVYLSEHPETVRTATLLRSTLLGYPVLEHFADSSQRALDLMFARCEQDEACREAFPDLRKEFDAIQARVEEEPVPTSIWDAARRVVVTPEMFSSVIHYMLMGADSTARIPRLIHRAFVEGDWDAIGRFHLEQIKPLQSVVLQQAMPVYILCNEPWALYRPEQVAQNGRGSYFSTAQVEQAQLFVQLCPAQPAPDPQAMYATPQKTDVAVLVLNAEEDPQNPSANVADTTTLYPNSLVLFEPYRAHFRSDWSCSGDILTEFIEAGEVKDLKADCLEQIAPVPFDVSP